MRKVVMVAGCVALSLLLGACAREHVVPSGTPKSEVERLLTEMDESEYVRSERCLSSARYDNVEMVGDDLLLFHGRGDRYWVNRTRSKCSPVGNFDTLIFDLRTSQVCEFDTVRPAYKMLNRWQKGAPCTLGQFEELNAAQAQLLKQAIEAD